MCTRQCEKCQVTYLNSKFDFHLGQTCARDQIGSANVKYTFVRDVVSEIRQKQNVEQEEREVQ